MQQVRFEAQKREAVGKGGARALRREGYVPAVLYGRQKEAISIQLPEHSFQNLLRSHGNSALVDLDIANVGVETAIIKEVQRDPVRQRLLHADFLRISLDEPVTSTIPIVLVGSAPGVQGGGIVELPHRDLEIHCLPTLLPSRIEVDISNLEIGDSISVADLALADEIEILDDPRTRIVTVSPPRIIEEEEEAEEGLEVEGAEADEATEPELISRRSDEE